MEVFIKVKCRHEIDEERSSVLNKLGMTVLRFKNEEVINDSKVVTDRIIKIAESLPSQGK